MIRSFAARLWTVLFLAAAIRLIGIGYGLPGVFHQDEPIYVNRAMAIGASGDLNPHFFTNGALPLYILFAWYGLLYAVGFLFRVFPGPDAFGNAFLTDPSLFFVSGRVLLGALAGTATVWFAARLAARRISPEAGLAAGFFLAVNYLHVTQSHYLYADVPLTLCLTALLALLADFLFEPSRRRAAAAGVVMGAALACKMTAAYLAPAALAAFLLAAPSGAVRPDLRQRAVWMFIFGASALAALFIFSPFIFLDWSSFYQQMQAQRLAESPLPWTFHLSHSVFQGTGFAAVFLAFAGILVLWKMSRRLALFLSIAAVSFYAGSGFMGMHFSRRMLPLMPILAVLAGCGWVWLAGRVRSGAVRTALFAAVAVTTALPAVYLDGLFLKEDTRAQALAWFEANVRPGSTVVVDNRFFGPRLVQTAELLEEKERLLAGESAAAETYMSNPSTDRVRARRIEALKKLSGTRPAYRTYALSTDPVHRGLPLFMLPVVAPEAGALEAAGAEYLVFNSIDAREDFHALKRTLGGRLERVAVFSPYGGADAGPAEPLDRWENTAAPHAWAELFRRQRLGPHLEVYRLKPAAEAGS